jgi:hypothetical protein
MVAGQTKPPRLGAENHRHVAGEIDGADCISVVVDVRRMQPGLAAVVARPLRPRAYQPHTGAARVVMHLPVSGEEGIDVFFGKEIGSPLRSVDDRDAPVLTV